MTQNLLIIKKTIIKFQLLIKKIKQLKNKTIINEKNKKPTTQNQLTMKIK